MPNAALDLFHPLLKEWFTTALGAPTDAQTQAWPIIARGEHALITAPTGSGKTLTAFLWSINQFITGDYECGATRVLYVSPLKALNSDVQRNLLTPIQSLRERFAGAGQTFPEIRVATRSGDTPSDERSRLLRKPPEILITTPESLNLMLSSKNGRRALSTLQVVILDEIHDVVSSRRGLHLITAVERAVQDAGEFQRIALSATVRPLPPVAAWLGGFQLVTRGRKHTHQARTVHIIESRDVKQLDVRVELPDDAIDAMHNGQKIWQPIARRVKQISREHRATLIFTNSRRLAERVTQHINEDEATPFAYAHHGSLAREIRTEVERRLKAGELKAIVATSSLEMGIDIGELDQVVMLQSPPSVAAAIQRTGRAGHAVGAVARGLLVPTFEHDYLEAAALIEAIDERDIEPLNIMENALDILAQVIVSACGTETWDVDDLYEVIRCASPYHRLSRKLYDLVLEMLAGRYASTRIQGLTAKVAIDRDSNTVSARKGALLALYSGGGTIPNRGHFTLRNFQDNARIGELDEEFVWEATVGQIFSLGTQQWRIHRITHNDVFVEPSNVARNAPPFWRSEGFDRSHHFSLRIANFLHASEHRLAERGGAAMLNADLQQKHRFNDVAAEQLTQYLVNQRDITERALPHRFHLLVEHLNTGPGGYHGPDRDRQVVLHTMWGGRVNRPLGLALRAAWQSRFAESPELSIRNDALVFQYKADADVITLLGMIDADNIERWLRQSLEGSSFFGARFRECAGRALLLAPRRFNHRQPLWMTRLQAKKIMTAVADRPDFPLLLETWRTCLNDEFDLPALRERLNELRDGVIEVDECHTQAPSPFARDLTFSQINQYMYADDAPESQGGTFTADELIRTALSDTRLRPRIHPDVIARYEEKRQRLAPGYAPTDATELLEWIKERVALTESATAQLRAAVSRDCDVNQSADPWPSIANKLAWLRTSDGRRFLVAKENVDVLTRQLCTDATLHDYVSGELCVTKAFADDRDDAQLVLEMLSFYGPKSSAELHALLPSPVPLVDAICAALADGERCIHGALRSDSDSIHICELQSFEALMRLQRAQSRSAFTAKDITALPAFLAQWQGFGRTDVANVLETLEGFVAAPELFEQQFLSARIPGYAPHRLDEALRAGIWQWRGVGEQQIAWVLADAPEVGCAAHSGDACPVIFPDEQARYDFFQLADASSTDTAQFSKALWDAIWHGYVTANDYSTLREGFARGYRLPEAGSDGDAHPRDGLSIAATAAPVASRARQSRIMARRGARARARGWPGFFQRIAPPMAPSDAIDALELAKDRVRVLLTRYGVLSRSLMQREAAPFSWRGLFNALRLMELSGEVMAGHFFEGLSGPQFADPRVLRQWQRPVDERVFWISAVDPISPCGLEGQFELPLPRRLASNHLVFFGLRLVLTSENKGKRLRVAAEPDHAQLTQFFEPLLQLMSFGDGRLQRISVETINDAPAIGSPYLPALREVFDVLVDHKVVTLQRSYR